MPLMNRTVREESGAWSLLKKAAVRARPTASSSAGTVWPKFPIEVGWRSGRFENGENISGAIGNRDYHGRVHGRHRVLHNVGYIGDGERDAADGGGSVEIEDR